MAPLWLTDLATAWLICSAIGALAVAVDIWRGHGQGMKVMNLVWPISALWAAYAIDFSLAYLAGIAFQYFSIAPMQAFPAGRISKQR